MVYSESMHNAQCTLHNVKAHRLEPVLSRTIWEIDIVHRLELFSVEHIWEIVQKLPRYLRKQCYEARGYTKPNYNGIV